MTIDRSQEKDRNYLMNYYDGIENHSSGLILLKGLDKLDNAFIWVLRDLEERHWQIMFDFVCPRVAKVDHELAVYINDLTNYVIDGPKKHELRNKFQSHINKIQERENRIGVSH
jgi:flagellar motor component MotA